LLTLQVVSIYSHTESMVFDRSVLVICLPGSTELVIIMQKWTGTVYWQKHCRPMEGNHWLQYKYNYEV